MKENLTMFIGIFIFSLAILLSPTGAAQAAGYADGSYDVSFELKESGSNNTSIADGYFSKPAKLIVKNGVNYIQLTITESDWVKSVSGPKGNATVISESGNSRTIQFEAGDLSELVNLNMHVVVPEDVAGMKYDNHHSVRADFNTSGIPTAIQENNETSSTEKNDSIVNPKTGDSSTIGLYIGLLVFSIGVLTFYRKRTAKS